MNNRNCVHSKCWLIVERWLTDSEIYPRSLCCSGRMYSFDSGVLQKARLTITHSHNCSLINCNKCLRWSSGFELHKWALR